VTRIVALTTDLMDRSKLSAAIPGVQFGSADGADVVIVDLGRGAQSVAALRAAHPAARIVCYGPHVDDVSADAARAAGADAVLPRSKFFRDPAAAIAS
jgi:DNA-binding NarL/FixJ family response regulator